MKVIRMPQRIIGWVMALCLLVTCFSTALISLAEPTDTVYTKSNETYHAISGFETDDNAMSFAAGVSATDVKNNGESSHKLTVGDNTNVNAQISFHNSTPKMAGAAYVQFWVNNAAAADQYIAGLNFLGTGIQFNVPVGKQAILIDDATEATQTVTYANVRIPGLGTIRTLCIPAGFSGYVRISLAQEDLEVKAGTYGDDALNSFTKMSFYLGNTTTGGDIYIDDFGYITVSEDVPPVSVTNPIYTETYDTYHPMTGFEAEDVATVNIGVTATDSKNNGYNSHKFTVSDNTFISANLTLNESYPLSGAAYVQLWLKNATGTDQYLMAMNFQGSNFQYNVPAGKEATLIADADNTKSTVTWTNVRINGAGSVRTLLIPAGFSGYVRVSVSPEDLEVKTPAGGTYDAATFDTVKRIGFYFGNTATGGNIYMDDLGYITKKNPAAVYLENGETYHELANFDEKTGGGPVNTDNGYTTSVKNNGERSYMYTVPAGELLLVNSENPYISFAADADLADAKYVQFWMSNTSADPVYIHNFSIMKPNSFQYRLKAGANVQLIDEDSATVVNAARWAYVTIGNAVKNTRTIKIPAGFTGYVRIAVEASSFDSFDAQKVATATRFSFHLGSLGSGGQVYIDDVGYITGGENLKTGAAFADLSEQKTYTDENGNTMAYRLYLPEDYDANVKYPVLLYLHGNGFQGDDNLSHVTGQIGEPLDELVALGNRSEYPCIIVAPQCPMGDKWVDTTFANGSYSVDSVAETAAMGMVVDLLEEVMATYTTDEDRVYAMGVSMGAFGCWDMMIRHRGLLAAAVPMMGAGDPTKALWVGNTAVWAFHCATDGTVPVAGSQDMVAALQAIECSNVKYTEYSGLGHAAYRFAIAEEELLPWLFSQERDLANMPELSKPAVLEPATNAIYTRPSETYHAIGGFETGDTVTVANGAVDTDVKNNGFQSQKVTVGNDTFISAAITLGGSYALSEANYLQFWIQNATGTDQYLLGMNFLGNGFQYNVPVGKNAWLIADGSTTETTVTWTNIKITGAGTIRSLLIPAGFSGYVRVSVMPRDLEVKMPAGGTFDAATFDTTKRIGLYFGNTATGGDIYVDDLGTIVDPNYDDSDDKNEAAANPIYLEKDETYHTITGFEETDAVTSSIGVPDTDMKNNGYRSQKITIGDNTFTQSVFKLKTLCPFASAQYMQLWVTNAADTDQYLLSVSLQGDGFQYNVPTDAPVWLVTGDKKTETAWSSVKINGGGTMRGLLIPAGFSGYVRISLQPEHLAPKFGTYNKDVINKATRISVYMGNTGKGGDLYFDDLGYITNPNYTGLSSGDSISNPIYVEKGETFHEITGFEADDRVASNVGMPGIAIKNNGYQSHRYTVGNDTFMKVELTLNDTYPLSTATYVQFWLNNSAKTEQYLLSMSFQGDGFQYNVPTGTSTWLISGGKKTESVWESVRINGAGTMRGLLIPAGFSGYVRIPVTLYDLQPTAGRYDSSVFDQTLRFSLYLGNIAGGGDFYFDDVGYITNANVSTPDYDAPGQLVTNDIFLNEGDTYHLLTGFELDDTTSVTPFNHQHHNVSSVKNNGHYSYQFTLPAADFVSARIKFDSTDKLTTAEYLQFWISNPSNNNIYLFNLSFSDGNSFQYNIKSGAGIFLISDDNSVAPTMAEWSSPNIGTFKGQSFAIPVGFSGYVRIPLSADAISVNKPTDGKYNANTLAGATQLAFYIGNIDRPRYAYMDDVMLIDGEIMEELEPDYELDYSMDAVISLYGQILDAQGQPLKHATLLLNNYTIAKTDSNGYFVFDGVSMDCHTLSVLDENNKVYAQTAITIMPGENTAVVGSYITRHPAATNLIVNLRIVGSAIKIVGVAEGSLEVQTNAPGNSDAQEEPQKDLGWLWWVVLGVVIVAAAVAALLLVKRARKKQTTQSLTN